MNIKICRRAEHFPNTNFSEWRFNFAGSPSPIVEVAVAFPLRFPNSVKPIFHLAAFFARREAKTRIRKGDWLKLAGENIRREQVGNVPAFLRARANKFA